MAREKGVTNDSKTWGSLTIHISPETYSFLLFCVLAAIGVALFPEFYAVFIILIAADGLATVFEMGIVASIDRSAFFFVLLTLSVVRGSFDLFYLFLEMTLVFAALDISFLLRRLGGTTVEVSVLRSRLVSYAYTLLPAFLVSYVLTYLSALLLGSYTPEPAAALAVGSAGALLAIYAVSFYFPRERPR